jgi:RNA polymerase sigma-70 factor (ECF subfamily)
MRGGDKEQQNMVPGVIKLDPPGGAKPAGKDKPADEQIAEAIDGGDLRRAVVICSREHGATIGRLCMSMLGSQQDAEDVTQETLIDAYNALSSWRREGSARSWLLSIARRKCARLIEKRVRRTAKLRLVHDADREASSDDMTEKQVLLKERADAARDALGTVRPSEREALVLRYGAGLSFREVGAACGIEEAAARKRVSRAIATLRKNLRDGGRQS